MLIDEGERWFHEVLAFDVLVSSDEELGRIRGCGRKVDVGPDGGLAAQPSCRAYLGNRSEDDGAPVEVRESQSSPVTRKAKYERGPLHFTTLSRLPGTLRTVCSKW